MNSNELMDAIAIVGMSGRFPGSPDIAHFWKSLLDGVESITHFTEAELIEAGVPIAVLRNPNYVKAGSYLEDIEMFDAGFFGISPREAEVIDPQHRLFLEHAWLALSEAGVNRPGYNGQVAVFGGASFSTYGLLNLRPEGGQVGSLETVLGNDKDYLATRVSYKLGLKGPSVSVQTACSTSLTAVAMACDALLNYQCDVALAGGVTVKIPKKAGYLYEEGSILSPDGHCRTFDARAKGTVFGSGVAVVALKRLEDAVADRDIIHAVIRGTGVNNDGDHKVGFTAPSVEGQARVIATALAAAGVSADTIGYVEAHGTATPMGDPIEVRALTQAFRAETQRTGFCGIGSVKTNVGHLESAAGITGLIKAVLAVKHGVIPPSLHFESPNPEIDFANSPFRVVDKLTPWPENGHPRRAGVNSFGMGGTNVHIVVEEPPQLPAAPPVPNRSHHILPLSAKSKAALRDLARSYADHLSDRQDASLDDIGFTAATSRMHFPHRLAVTGKSSEAMVASLRAYGNGDAENVATATVIGDGKPGIAFLFSGQGSQWAHMGRELFETEPRFRQTLERCDAILRPLLPKPLLSVMFPQAGDEALIDETIYTQPALFSLEYALADLWRFWNIEPSAVLGHSVGEYAAAAVAGVFSLEDGLRLIAARGRLMQALPQDGAMMTIFAPEAMVRPVVEKQAADISIAALNGPSSTVISGRRSAIAAAAATFEAKGIKARPLTVSHAFHSPLMQPMLEEFRTVAERIHYQVPSVPVISNLTGQAETQALTSPDYWVRHVSAPVRFMEGIRVIRDKGLGIFLEIGPHPVLCGLARECLADIPPDDAPRYLASLNRTSGDWRWMHDSLAQLYVSGVPINWQRFDEAHHRRRVELPSYPFQRKRFWLEPNAGKSAEVPLRRRHSPGQHHPLLGERLRQAGTREIRFESVLSASHPSYLADHRVFQTPVLPATAYAEMALTAGAALLKTTSLVLEDVVFRQAMTLPEGEERVVQTVLSPEGQKGYTFQIFSEAGADETWTLHCTGRLLAASDDEGLARFDIAALKARCDMAVPIGPVYENYHQRGLDYGPAFQGIVELSGGDGEALARLCLPMEARDGAEQNYTIHPALMDACFQALGAVLGSVDDRETYLPVGIGRLHVSAKVPEEVWSHARLDRRDDGGKDTHFASMRLCTLDGEPIVSVEGLQSRRTVREAVLPQDIEPFENWLYDVTWRPQELSSLEPIPPGSWLIVADTGSAGECLASRMRDAGGAPRLVSQSSAEFHDTKSLVRLLGETETLAGIVYLPGLDSDPAPEAVPAQTHYLSNKLLHLVQALVADGRTVPLYVVTKGAQGGVQDGDITNVSAASLWGFVRSVWHEYPAFHCACIDLDPRSETDEASVLLGELSAADRELQIAYRGGNRFVARLTPHREARASHAKLAIPDGPYRLDVSPDGELEGLQVLPLARRRPEAGEVEIEVRSMGLNFRDVLNVMGLYPGDAGPLGGECAGRIVRVGPGITDLSVGDEVVVMYYGTFASHVTLPAALAFKIPSGIPMTEAAGLPIVYLTAWYGLHHLAKIRKGDRILIHSAAGGVGIAAIRVAQWAGAEVFATASESKHEFLHSLGIRHVMNSRTLDFVDQVKTLTDGRGVDIVLNSLTGEAIPASLATVAPGGRFVEIGKRDVWTPEQVAALRPDISYAIVNFDVVSVEKPQLVRDLLTEALALIGSGELGRPVTTEFPVTDTVKAMALMQKARHLGKIVLVVPEPGQRSVRVPVRPDATYLVTGGLGGLGLLVARWLIDKGAKHLVLVSRRTPTADMQKSIAALQVPGVSVDVRSIDVSDAAALQALINEVDRAEAPLRGVLHAAGVLDDGVLTALNEERFARVLSPKVDGAWTLHRVTQERQLDFFVMFSSLGSVLGAAGQANYAAANAFMDALAHLRARSGLPALVVNWGGWSETGMTTGAAVASRLEGHGTITPQSGLQILERLVEEGATQVAVVPFRWVDYFEGLPRRLPLLEDIEEQVRQEAAQAQQFFALRQRLHSAKSEELEEILLPYLQSLLVRLLRFDPGETLDRNRPLAELGLDSLVSIQLRNRIRSELDFDLPVGTLMEASTLNDLATLIGESLRGGKEDDGVPLLQRLGRMESPLSFAQQRLFFMAMLDPDSPFYTVTFSLFLEGTLDGAAFQRAVAAIAERHESLRTVFPIVDGEPTQVILHRIDNIFSTVDLSALGDDERDTEVKRVVAEEARRTFDLAAGPLFHVTLVRLGNELHRAIVSWHHIITDGWSAVVFIQEVGALYEAFRKNEPSRLSQLPVQYADFAEWQRQWLSGERLERQIGFWKRRLEGPLPELNLPVDRPRDAASVHRGGVQSRMVAREVAAGLKEIARSEGVTLFTVLMAAFKTLLSRISGEEDLIIGSLVANRVRPEVEGLIGFFANMVVFRSDLGGNPTFRELVGRENAAVRDALAHQDVPFEKLVEEIRPERQPGRNPLTDIIFVLHRSVPTNDLSAGGLRIGPIWDMDNGTVRFDLEVHLWDTEQGISTSFVYNADLFDAGTIERIVRQFETLLGAVAANGDRPILELPLQSPEGADENRQEDVEDKLLLETLASLEGLSDEEVDALLRDMLQADADGNR